MMEHEHYITAPCQVGADLGATHDSESDVRKVQSPLDSVLMFQIAIAVVCSCSSSEWAQQRQKHIS